MDAELTSQLTSKDCTSNAMYKLILLAALLACAAAAPRSGDEAQIIKFDIQADTDGSFSHTHETSDGSIFSEQGVGSQYSKGFFAWVSPEGVPVQVSYVADENGYQPQSDLLPTPPPIPDHILRSIQYIQQHPTPEELADREVRARQL